MKNKKWDHYFYSHYRPEGQEWASEDLLKYRRWYETWLRYIEEKFSLKFKQKNILELGCGIGSVSTLFKDREGNITGSDISEVMVDHAKKISPEIPFIVYDAMDSFPKKQLFDFIVAFEVLEHIPELDISIKNIYDCLKKDGFFIGSTPYPFTKNMIDPTHVNVHLPFFWKTLFESHGFNKVETIPLSFFPFIWKIPPFYWNPVLTVYIPYPGFVSTTLIVAKK